MLVQIRNLNQWEWVWLNHNVTSFSSNPLQRCNSDLSVHSITHIYFYGFQGDLNLRHTIPTHTVLDTITQGWEKGTARPYYSTRKQTWQPSHPYSSKSCWSVPIRCCAPSSIPSTGDNHQAGMGSHVHLNRVKSLKLPPKLICSTNDQQHSESFISTLNLQTRNYCQYWLQVVIDTPTNDAW